MKEKEVLNMVVEKLMSDDDLPGTLMYTLFPIDEKIPSALWSLLNRLIMVWSGTSDARGFRQWNKVNRYVKKGSKAIWITAPLLRKVKMDNGEEQPFLYGFKTVPVFRYEDTDGENLEYMDTLQNAEEKIKQFPLMDIAYDMGLSVVADITRGGEAGSFGGGKIRMCNDEEETFFHELSHAIDKHLGNELKPSDPLCEVVAELSSACLATIYGRSVNLKFTKKYITGWSHGEPGRFIARALGRVQHILDFIRAKKELAA
jgi:hypothetical protein